MKKTVLAITAFFALQAGIGLAAPINDLAKGQTALGVGTDTFYLEHKISDRFTLGVQNIDLDHGNGNDIYGQFNLTENVRAIVGSRNFDPGSKAYAGMAVSGPVSPETNGYASLIGGSNFKELQLGTNTSIAQNVDLNLAYHSFMPDAGSNKNSVDFGATLKF